jgi:hypothetical protein
LAAPVINTPAHLEHRIKTPDGRTLAVPSSGPAKVPNGYCPNHATGVKLPDNFVVTPFQSVD